MEKISENLEQTKDIAKSFLDDLINKNNIKSGPIIVELVGDLGAGKTTFMKGVGEYFQIKETVISPTFLIQRNYDIPEGFPFKKLVHIDAYRIEDHKELDTIDWKTYSNDKDNIIFIEWSNNLKQKLPANSVIIEFFHENETSRKIKYEI